jgi:hypothetical protein
MSEPDPAAAQSIFSLRKRVSPSDYLDGYIAGLRFANEVITRLLSSAEESRRISEHVHDSDTKH